jgi:hypothetical protein
MEKDVLFTLIGAASGILGAIIGAISGWFAGIRTNQIQKAIAEDNLRAQQLATLEAMFLKMNELAVVYPTLEKDKYCLAYPNLPGDENGKARYEAYVCYVFNVLEAYWEYCGRSPERIMEMIDVEELVQRHWRCWEADPANESTDPTFRSFIVAVKRDLQKRGKIQ